MCVVLSLNCNMLDFNRAVRKTETIKAGAHAPVVLIAESVKAIDIFQAIDNSDYDGLQVGVMQLISLSCLHPSLSCAERLHLL